MKLGLPVLMTVLALPASGADFTSSARGSAAAQFLTLGAGARAAGMGEAYSAVTDDASALYWNPAAMTRIQRAALLVMHSAYLEDSFFDYGSYVHNLSRLGVVGIGIQYFSAPGLMQTDITGAELGRLTPKDIAITGGYARTIEILNITEASSFSIGCGLKVIRSEVVDSAESVALDIGVLSSGHLDKRLDLALTLVNLGGTLKFDQARENLPLMAKVGAATMITPHWIVASDIYLPRASEPFAAVGSEYRFYTGEASRISGRVGFNSETVRSLDGFSGATLGIGIGFNAYEMDYSLAPLGTLGQAHRFSLTRRF